MFIVNQHDKRDISWWYSRVHTINFSPSYQRRGQLWDIPRKAQLIDSIINGYDLPKFYLVDFTSNNTELNEGGHNYAIVDGKQRLETIFGFLRDEFPLSTSFHHFANPDLKLGGLRFTHLKDNHPSIAETIAKYPLPVMSIVTDEKARIDEMYVRLNVGISLNGAEVRNAMPGIIPELIRKMVIHEFFEKKIVFKTWRMQDFNVAAKLLLIEQNGTFSDTKKASLDRFTRQGEGLFKNHSSQAFERCWETLDRMCEVFRDKDFLLKTEAPIPIYYWIVRNVDKELIGEIRPFLMDFESSLSYYKQQVKNHPVMRNALLDDYNLHARSSNHSGSIQRRYSILMSQFENFVRTGRSEWSVNSSMPMLFTNDA